MGLVIAPDSLLAKFTLPVEQHSHNLGCGSMNAALCANKVTTGKLLKSHGIPVPADAPEGRHVVKPVSGCDSQGVRLTTDAPGQGRVCTGIYRGRALLGQPCHEPGRGRGLPVLLRQPAACPCHKPAVCYHRYRWHIHLLRRGDTGPSCTGAGDHRYRSKSRDRARLPGILRRRCGGRETGSMWWT